METVVDASRGVDRCYRGVRRPDLGFDAEEFDNVGRRDVLNSGMRLDLKGAAIL